MLPRLLAVAALGALVPSCLPAPPPPVYAVRRSALVPHPSPPMHTGHTVSGLRAGLRDSTVIVPVDPLETDGANAGLYVARHNLGADFRAALSRSFELGVSINTALLRDAMPIAEDAADKPFGDHATGAGMSLAFSVDMTDRWAVGIDARSQFVSIPYHEEGTCIANCAGAASSYEESGHHTVWISGVSLLPSYRDGDLTAYGSVTATNHPTNTKSEHQTDWQNMQDDADEVREGPTYVIVGAGFEYAWNTARIGAQLFWPVSRSIADYGPALGITLAVEHDYSELLR